MKSSDSMLKMAKVALIASSGLVVLAAVIWGVRIFMKPATPLVVQSTNPTEYAIGGFPMDGATAPDFALIDQFGRPVTLSSLRGHEVVLAFIDARCKTLCPLTAQIMYNAKARLGGSVASQVELVAVNANPTATSVAEVQGWSISHGMLHQWLFLTGTAQELQSIYKLYNVPVEVSSNDAIEHAPILFIIDAQGHQRLYFETLNTNAQADVSSQERGLEAGMRQWLPQS